MSTLARQQQALLGALLATPRGPQAARATADLAARVCHPWERGLVAYRANSHALAERSLLAAYPVVAALLGEDSFAAMAREFWHRHPPGRGDLAEWGEALPAFVARQPQLADLPYLADVARVEWALHRAAGAPDAAADPASFSMLVSADPDTVTLRLPPGTAVVNSPWPVASLVMAHQHGAPSLEEAGARLRAGRGECAVIWRQGLRPRMSACGVAAFALTGALLEGAPVLAALQAAHRLDAQFDLGPWLAQAVQDGLVLGVAPAPVASAEDAPIQNPD